VNVIRDATRRSGIGLVAGLVAGEEFGIAPAHVQVQSVPIVD
jgi:hypothetical protein